MVVFPADSLSLVRKRYLSARLMDSAHGDC